MISTQLWLGDAHGPSAQVELQDDVFGDRCDTCQCQLVYVVSCHSRRKDEADQEIYQG